MTGRENLILEHALGLTPMKVSHALGSLKINKQHICELSPSSTTLIKSHSCQGHTPSILPISRNRATHSSFKVTLHLLPAQLITRPLSASTFAPVARNRMHSWIQFVTTPTVDTPGTALVLHYDQKRYLIGNIHEGACRASVELGAKMSKLSEVFMTGKTDWKTTGGLIGMILTMADSIKASAAERTKTAKGGEAVDPTLTIHGGLNITHTLATARRFTFRQGMPLKIKEYPAKERNDWKPDWEDTNIKVWAMSVAPYSGKNSLKSKSPRKRNYNDFVTEEASAGENTSIAESNLNSSDRDQRVRENVVIEMFSSKWRVDNLDEVLLSEVQLPAQIFVREKDTNALMRYNGPLPNGTEKTPDIKVLVRRPWPGALQVNLPPTKPSHNAISYVIRSQQQRGKFLPQKAKELKVPSGPLWAQLAQGFNVTSQDGQTVKPEMVLEPPRHGGGVVIADLPSHDYVHGLINRQEWWAEEIMAGVEAVIWILGSGVSRNEELQNFINEHKHLKHVISSPDLCPNYIAFGASASSTIRFNQIDPIRHRVPLYDNETLPQNSQESIKGLAGFDFTQAVRGLKIQLMPSVSLLTDKVVPPLDTAAVVEQMSPDVLRLAEVARKEIERLLSTDKTDQNLPSPDAEIICLGTGSALPSKYRNVSATLLRVPGSGSYLFDCGENTLGQLRRIFSSAELSDILRDLKIIWISHLHADHHLGITSVIKAWYEEVFGKDYQPEVTLKGSPAQELANKVKIMKNENRLFVVSQSAMLDWLREYSSVEDFGYDRLIPVASIGANYSNSRSTLEWNREPMQLDHSRDQLGNAFKAATGLSNLVTCFVTHCNGAQAVSLTFPDGFKFSYSGDCRPSKTFAKIGKGSTVLLHEATFDDELQVDAEAKKHSTTSEALAVGMAMGARRVVLTHFSQRYQKIPVMDTIDGLNVPLEADEVNDDVPVGLDQTEVLMGERALNSFNEGSASQKGLEQTMRLNKSRESDQKLTESAIPGSILAGDMKVCVAFDYMRVKVGEILYMEKFTPALLKLFEEPEPVGENLDGTAQEDTKSSSQKKEGKKRERKNQGAADGGNKGSPTDNQKKINKKKSGTLKDRGKTRPEILLAE